MVKNKILQITFLPIICLLFTSALFAQQNVGIGTTTPAPSAKLDVTANDKGILIPRLTTAQRAAITSPANGLMLYDTDTKSFWYYNGTAWANMAVGSGWKLDGNVASSTDFIGTTNDQPLIFKSNNLRVGYLGRDNNLFPGNESGNSNTGYFNTAVGGGSFTLNTSGNSNVSVHWK